MECPYCQNSELRDTDSRSVHNAIRRRRECTECEKRFTTYERIQTTNLLVTKQDGRQEDFNRSKLVSGLSKACAKRPVTSLDIEDVVDQVENELMKSASLEVTTYRLGGLVMEKLKEIDTVAYIRWASVYKDFQNVESFQQVVAELLDS